MFGRIMVPLDGSELAERALPCAERLARLMGATLHLVRVAGPVFETTNSAVPETETELERDDADFLVAEMRAAEAYLARARCSTMRVRRTSTSWSSAVMAGQGWLAFPWGRSPSTCSATGRRPSCSSARSVAR